jgi:hypothetical protein
MTFVRVRRFRAGTPGAWRGISLQLPKGRRLNLWGPQGTRMVVLSWHWPRADGVIAVKVIALKGCERA